MSSKLSTVTPDFDGANWCRGNGLGNVRFVFVAVVGSAKMTALEAVILVLSKANYSVCYVH